MNKNFPKLVKHIFPSNKQWTGVWSAGFGGIHLPLASIGRVNTANLVKFVKTNYNYARVMKPAKMTYKSAASDEYILGIRKET